ncbi:MAG: FAD-binding oxidoreductase [Marinosulfonomonas sp.]|nr:FAD-binding oxidoreductase [Marinosulfonomonas sp.]
MQPAEKPAASIWEATSPARMSKPALTEPTKTEIVVIGGGLTGLSAALHLARKGHQVTLLESHTIGFGGSGRNNGQVIPVLSAAEPDRIEREYGEVGTRFVNLLQNSATTLFDLIRTENIDCEANQTGWFQPAHSAAHMRLSESRTAAWQKRSAPARLLDQNESRDLIGSDQWHGGMFNPTGGHINPLMFTRGLADTCADAGVKIHENTPVTNVSRNGQNWQLKTPDASLIAGAVLLATNAYTGGIAPPIKRSFIPITSWQMATKPLTAKQNASILPTNPAISDTRGDLQFFRKDAGNRLITGSALMFKTNAPARLRKYIAKRLTKTFPQLPNPQFSHIWCGYVGITTDFFPRFHQLGPNYVGFAGYNGRGLALPIPLGIQPAEALLGANQSDLAIPLTKPNPIPLHTIAKHIAPAALAQYRWRDMRPPRL